MHSRKSLRFKVCIVALLAILFNHYALASTFPDRPVTLVVPFAAGGGTDVMARLMATQLTVSLGKPVIVVNKPGAGGEIAVAYVRASAPDGYTLLVTSSNFAVAPFVTKNVTRDTMKDFAHIIKLVESPWVLVVNNKSSIKTINELITIAKERPKDMNWGIVGADDFEFAYFLTMANINIQGIRYGGSSPLIAALLNNEVQGIFNSVRTIQPFLEKGQLRPLAVSSAKRFSLAPSIPTIAESGIPEYDGGTIWFGVTGPAGVPTGIVNKLNSEFNMALRLPEIRQKIEQNLGYEIVGGSPQDFIAQLSNEIRKMKQIAKQAGIVPQ